MAVPAEDAAEPEINRTLAEPVTGAELAHLKKISKTATEVVGALDKILDTHNRQAADCVRKL